ncbi:hypothetical protein HK097_008350 [Rhizophlyctis rosea]|uniref:NodB homology domain-containing protein n=1 Tax=Rhizophlyctis rosea TaxID=64517 RepID=A0AAD5SAD3_9FUNG|nr:hypothetical protein HK097_008350 [Rhizophlyctis rosea]
MLAFAWDDGTMQYQQSKSKLSEQKIIDQFNAANFKTTFITTGKLYNCIYNEGAVSSLRSAYASGHQLASHSWSHNDMGGLTPDEQKLEPIEQSYDAIIAGVTAPDGGIILAQEFYNSSANGLLPRVSKYAQDNGLKLVTVAECVGDTIENAYKEVGIQGNRDVSWVC